MLSPNELSTIFKIISNENQTFKDIAQSYKDTFKDIDKIGIALSLCILLKDNLLNITQRLISFYIIYLLKKNFHLEIGPFLPLIIETIQTSKYKTEQNFLFDLLNDEINYVNSTVINFLKDETKTKYNKANLLVLQNLYREYLKQKPNDKKMDSYIRHVLYDRKKNDIKNIENHDNINIINDINIKQEMSLEYFQPNYLSFCPGIDNKQFLSQEPIWIMPYLKHEFNWEKLSA